MSPKRKQRYLYIDGKAIPVTEKVYRAFWHYEDKEDYFMRFPHGSKAAQLPGQMWRTSCSPESGWSRC